jgi:hypothetical protein
MTQHLYTSKDKWFDNSQSKNILLYIPVLSKFYEILSFQITLIYNYIVTSTLKKTNSFTIQPTGMFTENQGKIPFS